MKKLAIATTLILSSFSVQADVSQPMPPQQKVQEIQYVYCSDNVEERKFSFTTTYALRQFIAMVHNSKTLSIQYSCQKITWL